MASEQEGKAYIEGVIDALRELDPDGFAQLDDDERKRYAGMARQSYQLKRAISPLTAARKRLDDPLKQYLLLQLNSPGAELNEKRMPYILDASEDPPVIATLVAKTARSSNLSDMVRRAGDPDALQRITEHLIDAVLAGVITVNLTAFDVIAKAAPADWQNTIRAFITEGEEYSLDVKEQS